MPNRHRPFSPDPAQIALKPAISGNTINGLGETTSRRPRMVYWAPDPDTIAHGGMQRWFYRVDPGNPHMNRAREERAKVLASSMPEVTGDPVARLPEDWNKAIAEFGDDGKFDMWGVARMEPVWVYEGQHAPQHNIIMLGFAHDYEQIATAPEATAGAEVVRQYGRAAAAAKSVAGWLRLQGWDAEPLTGPMTSKVMMIPPAIACGFGELGKHGSLINAEYGSSFRISAVLTDAPFMPTPKRTFEVELVLHQLQDLRERLPARGYQPVQANGPRRREMVRGLRPMPAVFQRDAGMRDLHRGVSVEPTGCRLEFGGKAGASDNTSGRVHELMCACARTPDR